MEVILDLGNITTSEVVKKDVEFVKIREKGKQ
jgi:hypothetical protein